jgi:hypothetical protein
MLIGLLLDLTTGSHLDEIFLKASDSLLQILGIVEEAVATLGTRRLLASPHLSCT